MNEKFVRPDYDIIIGPIADNTLQNWFNKIEEEGDLFLFDNLKQEIAPKLNPAKTQNK